MQLRDQIHQYVDAADDRLLKLVKAMMDEYFKTEQSLELSPAQKAELDARKERHLSGESASYTWEEVKARLQNKAN